MTRFLSSVLGAREPTFSLGLRQLEQAAGTPGTDIRLTTDIMQRTRAKIVALGLDPKDTTGPELYSALVARLAADESRVRTALAIPAGATPYEVTTRVGKFLQKQTAASTSFALKASVAKRLLKKKPPKVAMKRLGYRSVDSMIKHEPVAQLYAAAFMVEPQSWHRDFREQYGKLSPSDFEPRKLTLLSPSSKHWQALADDFVNKSHQNILTFKELGTVVMLPLAGNVTGLTITTLLLLLEETNALRAHSSYLKLQQVKLDFGRIVQQATDSEPYTSAELAGQPVPWRMIHRFYAQGGDVYHPELFEPHVQPDDLTWLHGEDVLAKLEPALRFWQGTASLGLLHDGQPVSCNVLDIALSYCNHLSYADRVVRFVRDNIWHELMLGYLHQHNLEEAVHRQLTASLTESTVLEQKANV